MVGWLLLFSMYLPLDLLARHAHDIRRNTILQAVARQARIRTLFFFLIVILHGIQILMKDWPNIPSVLIFGLYVLLSFNQDRLIGILRWSPQWRRRR